MLFVVIAAARVECYFYRTLHHCKYLKEKSRKREGLGWLFLFLLSLILSSIRVVVNWTCVKTESRQETKRDCEVAQKSDWSEKKRKGKPLMFFYWVTMEIVCLLVHVMCCWYCCSAKGSCSSSSCGLNQIDLPSNYIHCALRCKFINVMFCHRRCWHHSHLDAIVHRVELSQSRANAFRN